MNFKGVNTALRPTAAKNTTRKEVLGGLLLAALLLGGSVVVHTQAPDDAADIARLVVLLDLHRNSVVADIGAGSGVLSVGIAAYVVEGSVYSTDIEPQSLQEIREAVVHAGLKNVRVVEGGLAQTNLPDKCCDGVFMRDVYHHFGDPSPMNGSLLRSLKPEGRIVVIDFAPPSGHTAPPGQRDRGADHGILPADVIDELNASGFIDVHETPWSSPGYFAVIGSRPREGHGAR